MGVELSRMVAVSGEEVKSLSGQMHTVFHLARNCIEKLIENNTRYSHLVVATSCPDSIAPSLGQTINQHFNQTFANAHTIDVVQGCAGGVSAMILASQLAEFNKCNILLLNADAAHKATSVTSEVHHVFSNGVFGCRISYTSQNVGLIHSKTSQYKDLYDVVTIRLGHDADDVITRNYHDMRTDQRKYLGLHLNNQLAIKLMQKAESFYLDFTRETGHPDILILHQVNVPIINYLEKVFQKYPVRFINMAAQFGNCGCATTGILLEAIKNEIVNKKVMICSFGTGGVIVAGLWQF